MSFELDPDMIVSALKLAAFTIIVFFICMVFVIFYGRRVIKYLIRMMKGRPYWRDQSSSYSKYWLMYGVLLYGISSLTCESSFADLMAIQCGFVAFAFQIVSLISSLDAPNTEIHERAD